MREADLRTRLTALTKEAALLHSRLNELLVDLDGPIAHHIQVPQNGRWTKLMVAQLWESSNHLPGVCALFEETALHPNNAVGFSSILARSGLDERQQRNEHARLTRNATTLFGTGDWPIQRWQTVHDGTLQQVYRMGGTVAEWWHEITNSPTQG